jgi:hypothetical protein
MSAGTTSSGLAWILRFIQAQFHSYYDRKRRGEQLNL